MKERGDTVTFEPEGDKGTKTHGKLAWVDEVHSAEVLNLWVATSDGLVYKTSVPKQDDGGGHTWRNHDK